MQTPEVSIIIPCYNHGRYIDETIASIQRINKEIQCEVIIIDDGSKDELTQKKLKAIQEKSDYIVLFQTNQGVSAARNNGIKIAKAPIILALDADNRLHVDYIPKALNIFKNNPKISVVYAHGNYFGDQSGIKYQMPFNLHALLTENYIDSCALFKKQVWIDTEGYDVNMRTGLEDWEFWINAAKKGHQFHNIDEPLFDYRVTSTSRTANLISDKTKTNVLMDYMTQKHAEFYGPQFTDEVLLKRFHHSPLGFIMKLFLRAYFPAKYNKYAAAGKLRKYII